MDLTQPQLPEDQQTSRPLEAYLAELREHGYTVLDGVVDSAALGRIREATLDASKALAEAPPDFDDRFGVPNGIAWSRDICRAVTHPGALWVIRSYLETTDIHFCHQPAMTVLRPAKELIGHHPESGWHSDYPYHPDVYPDDRWTDAAIYGVQFNICIDAFRQDNAATQFVPQSHQKQCFPPIEMNRGGTRMGTPPHETVAQMVAPEGAALIYDSRIWHRACPELNVSGMDRLAILNAVCPNWVRPMVDKRPGEEVYIGSDMATNLPSSVAAEIKQLCCTPTQTPPDNAPKILERLPGPRKINI